MTQMLSTGPIERRSALAHRVLALIRAALAGGRPADGAPAGVVFRHYL